LDYIEEAAYDPDVLAIKQTLYRVSGDSPVVDSLIKAATNGKQVTVLVELKARFDEENNINWARKLEKAGCHVVYGLIGLKTHCKICLVVRREPEGIKRYIHLGTGNYNDSTAKVYTDISFFTCRETFGQDISALFNVLTGYSNNKDWNKISVAPHNLREMITAHIKRETENAKNGLPASITWKLNSLVDTGIIQLLYDASKAGVVIKLLVRGICCLKPGVEGLSENITVGSIIDRFLEHSRIYRFENGGTPKLYLSSADMMPRNLDRRVEVAFPIEDKALAEKAEAILDTAFTDTVKLRLINPDGSCNRVDRRGKPYVRSQEVFHAMH
jgi:polyphosphate kinase